MMGRLVALSFFLFLLCVQGGGGLKLIDPSAYSASVNANAQVESSAVARRATSDGPNDTSPPESETHYRYLLVNGGSEFFGPVLDGFNKTCHDLGVTCEALSKLKSTCDDRNFVVRNFVASVQSDTTGNLRAGIVYKKCGDQYNNLDRELILLATNAGIPVVEFDGAVLNSTRVAYVGTDNYFMGTVIAKLLRQLRPEGGTFAVVAPKPDRLDGFLQEIKKDNHRSDRAHWYRLPETWELTTDNYNDYMMHMEEFAKLNPTALIFMKQSPMRHENWTQFVDKHRNKNITLIGVDGSDFQLDYLDRRYVDGLVGQLPYEFGTRTLQVLHKFVTTGELEKHYYDVNVVAYNLIPVTLPPVQLDENLLGNLKWIGLSLFGVIALASLACVLWTWRNRQTVIVNAAQPVFLIAIATGVFIMASTLIPLSFDDGGAENDNLSEQASVAVCMSIPWLASSGFTVTFAALFSKTWRINRIFNARGPHYVKVVVREQDVLLPFAVLISLNIIVLICWTVIDPLTYVRIEEDGTDFWNRAIASYGKCQSDKAAAYLIPLALINGSVLLFASWQAYLARDIKVEFAESLYIGHTMSCLIQGFLTGIPLVVVVRETPTAFYLVLTLLIAVLCIVTLSLIFLPKVIKARTYARMSEHEQKKMLKERIMETSRRSSLQRNTSSSSGTPSGEFHCARCAQFMGTGTASPRQERSAQESRSSLESVPELEPVEITNPNNQLSSLTSGTPLPDEKTIDNSKDPVDTSAADSGSSPVEEEGPTAEPGERVIGQTIDEASTEEQDQLAQLPSCMRGSLDSYAADSSGVGGQDFPQVQNTEGARTANQAQKITRIREGTFVKANNLAKRSEAPSSLTNDSNH